MNVILYMAISANGFIARENGDEDFLSHENWNRFCDLANKYNNFIVGRKTYEAVKNWKDGYGFDDLNMEKIVVSQDASYPLSGSYSLATSPHDALAKLAEKGFQETLLAGGSALNTAFAKAGLIDEIVLNVEPVVIGKGIPLFSSGGFELPIELLDTSKSDTGIATLRYKVKK
ncbi:MAG: dihydrofolate reductase family protein [Candidatus Paceibacterota bacterium]